MNVNKHYDAEIFYMFPLKNIPENLILSVGLLTF